MSYKVVADKYQMDDMRTKYGPRNGLEGPFNFSGRVLYYDNKMGQYYRAIYLGEESSDRPAIAETILGWVEAYAYQNGQKLTEHSYIGYVY